MGLFLLGFIAGVAATVLTCVVLYRLTPDEVLEDARPDPLRGWTPPSARPHHATGFDTADLDGQ